MSTGTIIVLAIVIVLVGGAVYSIIRRKKSGKGTCSCGCSGCGMSDICHGEKVKEK